MSDLPIEVTAVGEASTHPAFPSYDIKGTLDIQGGNIVFDSENLRYGIPMEHIDQMTTFTTQDSYGDLWRFLVLIFTAPGTGFMAVPFCLYFFYWEYTSIKVFWVITAWDEYHGLKATNVFALGRKRSGRERVYRIIKEIWERRGSTRRQHNSRSTVIVRG